MSGERVEPAYSANERDTEIGWLEYHRATLGWKCSGLSSDDLVARAVPPSSLSLIGLVRHMTNVERVWFRIRFRGEAIPLVYLDESSHDDAFEVLDLGAVDESMAAWHFECAASREVLAAHSLDDLAPLAFRGTRLSMRWVVSHMVEEYARHNGHADLLRERIDGATGD